MGRLQFLGAAILVLLSTTARATDDVIVLIHPKCALQPDDLLQTDTGKRLMADKRNQTKRPYRTFDLNPVWTTFVSGTSLKDVPRSAGCFVLELQPTKTVVSQAVAVGKLAGDAVDRRVPYINVVLHQPFKLWYLKNADSQPELLGESTTFTFVSQLQVSGGGTIGKLQSGKPADLARIGLVEIYEQFTSPAICNSFMGKIMTTKPLPGTADIKPPVIGAPSYYPHPAYKASRVSTEKDGSTIVEIDLHNRLPVWANCGLSRNRSEAESNAFGKLPAQVQKDAKTWTGVQVELAPGEKKTARFVVPSMPIPPKVLGAATIFASATLSSESISAPLK